MKKLFLFLLLSCFGACICINVCAKGRKRPGVYEIEIVKVKTPKSVRSIIPPIVGTIDPSGNSIVLSSFEDSDAAYITISGCGESLADMVNFTDRTAALDVSELGAGVYTLTVEFENGAIYVGKFEFIEE